jgi:hypothetical protein
VVQDAFQDSNGVVLSAHQIAPVNVPSTFWQQFVGVVTIQSNLAHKAPGQSIIYVCDPGVSDGSLTCQGNVISSQYDEVIGVIFRFQDLNNFWVLCYRITSQRLQLYKRLAGQWTQVLDIPQSQSSALQFTVNLSGSSIQVSINGNSQQVSDSSLQTATKMGIYGDVSEELTWGQFTVNGSGGGSLPLVITFPNVNVYHSPYNWMILNGAASLATPGGYLKGVLTGTGSIFANVDTTVNNGVSPNNMPSLACYVIDRTATDAYGRPGVASPMVYAAIPSNNTNGTPVLVIGGLNPGHAYEYVIFGVGTSGLGGNGWTGTASWLKINSLQFDSTAVLSPYTPQISLAVFLGDSNIQGYFGDSVNQPSYFYCDTTTTWPVWVANALGCEFMQRGIGSQGWVYGGSNYGFPAFPDSWNYLASGHAADFTSPGSPQYLFVVMGNNDHGQSGPAVQSAVQNWIASARAVPGLSSTKFFMVLPLNRMQSSYIRAGVTTAGDLNTFVIDLGANEFSFGTPFINSSAFESLDGLHLSRPYHGMVAAQVALQVQKALQH